jgi:hypothetical protein
MIKKRDLVFHAIPLITIIVIIAMWLSGVDSDGHHLPGVRRLIVLLLSAALWSLLFAVAMLVFMVRQKCWWFLAIAIPLLVARVVIYYFSEIVCGPLNLLFPMEYLIFYLLKHLDTKREKIAFTVVSVVLYGICCLLCAPTLSWLC